MKQPLMLYFSSLSELWERFSFYIVEALLVIYLISTKHLPQAESYQIVGTYIANSFILTVLGAYFGQNILGFKNSIYLGSILMAIGYALLLDVQTTNIKEALALIVVGSAFFKPNMACFIGTLYKTKNSLRFAAAYNIYYACIMIGVILSTSISGYVIHYLGWDWNFSLAASAMLLAFFIFWMGNHMILKKSYDSSILFDLGKWRWPLAICSCALVWILVTCTLYYSFLAYLEFIISLVILVLIFIYEAQHTPSLRNYLSCLILLALSGIFWSLLFQQFFSFNVMISQLVDRRIGHMQLAAPIFMGIESTFVIIFSGIISKLNLSQKIKMGFFDKYAIAFGVCTISFTILFVALYINIRPLFLWVILSYAFLGLGEAILAPTALAMITVLNREKSVGIMMASLYVFWGLGTKMSDVLAQLCIIPGHTSDFLSINKIFLHAITYYILIAFICFCFCIVARKFFSKHETMSL